MPPALLALALTSGFQAPITTVWEARVGFRPLFDGDSNTGWKGWKTDSPPPAWRAENGVLVLRPDRGEGGDLCTRELYGDFELRLEWKVSPGSNSGIIYRAGEDYEASWQTGPEYQILDDLAYGARTSKNSAGSLYDVYTPSAYVTRPPGQWNETRIIARGPHIEHWLNHVRIVNCEVGSNDWNARCGPSKFKAFPLFATKPKGFIVLQDHGGEVAYRKVRIKRL